MANHMKENKPSAKALRQAGRCTVCENKIKIQIRQGTGICSANCEREAGLGKYATREN